MQKHNYHVEDLLTIYDVLDYPWEKIQMNIFCGSNYYDNKTEVMEQLTDCIYK